MRWYQAGDAFVSASQSETQGLTSFEALACGLPVLCRADPCLDGVVENGRNGWQWQTDAEFSAALDALRASDASQRAEQPFYRMVRTGHLPARGSGRFSLLPGGHHCHVLEHILPG